MQSDPLRQAKQELTQAWESTHALAKAAQFEEAEVAWQGVLSHLDRLWVKAERGCQPIRSQFEPWQVPFKTQRKSDPLLQYLKQARDADAHSIQEVAEVLMGILSGTFGSNPTIRWTGPELVALPVTNSGVTYPPPESHLGQKLGTKHPVVLATHGCNYYADYLCAIRDRFFVAEP